MEDIKFPTRIINSNDFILYIPKEIIINSQQLYSIHLDFNVELSDGYKAKYELSPEFIKAGIILHNISTSTLTIINKSNNNITIPKNIPFVILSVEQSQNPKNMILFKRISDSLSYEVKYSNFLEKQQVKFKKLNLDAKIPTKGTPYAAGWDISTIETITCPAKQRVMIPTGLSLEISAADCYARIAPRSGLAVKNGIDVLAGVVDKDYRGEIKVIIYNTSDQDVVFNKGDKVAQIIFEKIYDVIISEAETLSETDRGVAGFGSTDQKS